MDWEAIKAELVAIGERQIEELIGRRPLLLEAVVRYQVEGDPEVFPDDDAG